MPSAGTAISAWRPKTESERQLVRSQLEKVASDGKFTASKRYPSMLRYIVEQTLEGNEDGLKERTLGVEVFHRPPDYDTNLDPVVRLCAVEVRKRLVQYYQSPTHAGELRIELNPGSYVPVFSEPATDLPNVDAPIKDAPIVEAIPAEAPFSATVLPEADDLARAEQIGQPKRTRKIYWLAVLVAFGVFIVGISILGARYWRYFVKPKSALEDVWSPLLTSSKPILLCMGGSKVITLPGSQLAELQRGADEDSSLQAFSDKNDFVPFSDVQILVRFLSMVEAHGHVFKIQNFRSTVSSQLREGPVVLIGALNNDWTLNRTSSLRFHFRGIEDPNSNHWIEETHHFPCGGPGQPACPPNSVYWIEDRLHPESRAWQVSAQAREGDVLKDYAIAARFTDEGTGQVFLVAAGIAGSGTRAAGEFLTDEADLKQLADSAGADWGKKNFEVVLSAQVVNGVQGKPKVEAKAFW
jgi:hypothetical protein